MRIEKAARQWLASLDHLAPSTLADYESVVRNHIIPRFGDIRAHRLTREQITSALMSISPGRRRRVVAVLRLIFAHHGTFTVPVKLPREAKQTSLRVPSLVDVEALAQRLGHYGDLVRVAAGSGLRWGELVALQPEDVSDDVVSVTRAWCSRSRSMKEPKSAAGVRKVLVLSLAYGALERRLGAGSSPLFVTAEQGVRVHQSNFARKWREARATLGLEWRFHDLRHTYATLLIQSGVSSVTLCAMLGHSKPSVTYDIYAGFFSDPVTRAREEMER